MTAAAHRSKFAAHGLLLLFGLFWSGMTLTVNVPWATLIWQRTDQVLGRRFRRMVARTAKAKVNQR